jgi:hypothetical protein
MPQERFYREAHYIITEAWLHDKLPPNKTAEEIVEWAFSFDPAKPNKLDVEPYQYHKLIKLAEKCLAGGGEQIAGSKKATKRAPKRKRA